VANTLSLFGFSPEGTVGGSTPNFKLSNRLVASTNATAIYKGDAVVPVTGSVTGYIQQATASTVALAGIFWGCTYTSLSQGRRVWSPYWPGSDANGDVTAYVLDDPQMVFMVQSSQATPIGITSLNQNVQLSVGTGNTSTGLSGMGITTPATTATLPFTIVGFVQNPPGSNGTDITTAFNWVLVTFNNEIFRAGLTSVS
jgi:hypothetical protein